MSNVLEFAASLPPRPSAFLLLFFLFVLFPLAWAKMARQRRARRSARRLRDLAKAEARLQVESFALRRRRDRCRREVRYLVAESHLRQKCRATSNKHPAASPNSQLAALQQLHEQHEQAQSRYGHPSPAN